MNITILQRDLQDKYRLEQSTFNPNRRRADDPLDPRLESPLGRLAVSGAITQREYDAGRRWQQIYSEYLRCIGAPSPFPGAIPLDPEDSLVCGPMELPSDEECERWTKLFKHGRRLLEGKGKRVFHAVNAIAVYEEPEEYGDREFKIGAAKIGLAVLADNL